MNSDTFESSFDRILNRTKNNIDRVNRRYNSNSSNNVNQNPELRSRSPSPIRRNENNNYFNHNSPKRYNYEDINKSNENISQSTLSNILNRLHVLENSNGIDNDKGGDIMQQLKTLHKTVQLMEKSINEIKDEIKEVQHNNSSLYMTFGRQEGFIDALKQEVDLRRSTISKWDIWAKSTESWREDIDNHIMGLSKQLKACERRNNDQLEGLSERATKNDLELFRDRMNMFTQQAISASMAAWHDRMELSVQNVEKQIAALWVTNDAVRNSGTNLASSDESGTSKANNILMPSELLVKGAVASAIRQLENDLEEKIESRVVSTMKNQLSDSQKVIKGEMTEFVSKVASDLGLIAGEDESVSPAMKIIAARKVMEKEIENMSSKIDDLSCAIISLQESGDSNEKNIRVEIRSMERKVEESIAIASSTLSSVNARCAIVEESTRNAELRIASSQSEIQLEFLNRLRDACESWANDRGALDRRILITERISEDIVERMKLTGNIIDSYFQTSPVMKKLEASANQYEVMQLEVSCLKQESRDLASTVSRLDATAARKNDISEIRERVAPIDQLLDQLSQNIANTRTLGEDVSTLKFALAGVEATVVTMTAEQQSQSSKMVAIESELNHQNSQVIVLTESQQKQGLTLRQVETQYKFEFGSFKENVSLLNTKLAEVDSRLRSMEITSKAQFASSQAELQYIQSKLSESSALQVRSKIDVPDSLSSYNDKISSIVERVANLEKASPALKKNNESLSARQYSFEDLSDDSSKNKEDGIFSESIISDTPSTPATLSKVNNIAHSNEKIDSFLKTPSSIEMTQSSIASEHTDNLSTVSSTADGNENKDLGKQRIRLDDFEENDIENIKATPTSHRKELTIDTSLFDSTRKKLETIKKAEESLYEDSESDWDKESITSEQSSLASPQNIGLPPRSRSPSMNTYSNNPPRKPSRDSTPPRNTSRDSTPPQKPSRSNSPTTKYSETNSSNINDNTKNSVSMRGPSPPRPPRIPSPTQSTIPVSTKVEAIIPINSESETVNELSLKSGLSVKERLKLRMESKKKGVSEEIQKPVPELVKFYEEESGKKEFQPPTKPSRKPSIKEPEEQSP